jgi:hypothetical protein
MVRERLVVRVCLVAVVLLALLPIAMRQLGMLEPYPALVMPGFAGAPLQDGQLTWQETTILAVTPSGEAHEVDSEELLPTVPVIRSAVVASAFASGLDEAGEPHREGQTASLMRRTVVGLPPGQTLAGTARAYDERTKTWLAQRLEELLPGIRVAEVQFHTHELAARPDRLDDAEEQLIREVTVELAHR